MNTKPTLTLRERREVVDISDARFEDNKDARDIADYDTRRFNLTPRQACRMGVFGEALVFKAAGGNILNHSLEDWASFVPKTDPDYNRLLSRPDLFGTIEVRRANRPHSPIPIRLKDRKSGVIVVQVYIPYTQPLATKDNPFPPITVGLHGILMGWAYQTDEGTTPPWAGNRGSIVVERRPIKTLDLKAVLGR